MKATKIKYEKTFNLGNYSNEVIGVELELYEGENAKDAIIKAMEYVDNVQYEKHMKENLEEIVSNPENRRYYEVEEAKQSLNKIAQAEDNLPF